MGERSAPGRGLAAEGHTCAPTRVHGQADHHTLLQNPEEAGVVFEAGRNRVRGDEQEHYGWWRRLPAALCPPAQPRGVGVGAHIFFLVLLTPGQPFLHSCSGPAPAHCKHHKTNYFGLETALLSVSRGLAK